MTQREDELEEEKIPYIPLMMEHTSLGTAPELGLPAGYSLRLFRPGDEAAWAAVTSDADEFSSPEAASAYFKEHFGKHYEKLAERCFLLIHGRGTPVGTSTGWFMDDDAAVGRLHWVAIAREHQGLGLCRPLVAAAMRLMRGLGHKRAMLTTQPKSWKGIRVYLNLGWKPYDDGSAKFNTGWSLVKKLSGHDTLSYFT
jgi:mycothiol synthase